MTHWLRNIFFVCILLPGSICHPLILVYRGQGQFNHFKISPSVNLVVSRPERVGYWEGPPFGGGRYQFEYITTSTRTLNDAMAMFASIDAPRLKLVIREEAFYSTFLKAENSTPLQIDYTFTIWEPTKYKLAHELWKQHPDDRSDHSSPNTPPPTMTIYLAPGRLSKEKIIIPRRSSLLVIKEN